MQEEQKEVVINKSVIYTIEDPAEANICESCT